MITSEIQAIRAKYPARFRFANVLPLNELPNKIKFRTIGNTGFNNIIGRARNLGAVPDYPAFGSTTSNEALYRMKKLGIDIIRAKPKEEKSRNPFLNLFRSGSKDYRWLGIIQVKKLRLHLEKHGIPDWLKLRDGEERNIDNAVAAIIGRMGRHEDILKPLDEECFLKEAAKTGNIFKGDYLVFASEILFGIESSDISETDTSEAVTGKGEYGERAKINNESQKIKLFIRAIKTLYLPDDLDSQFNLLTSILKRMIFLKDLDEMEMAKSRDYLFMSVIVKLFEDETLKRELFLKKFIEKYYPGPDNLSAQAKFLFLRLHLGDDEQVKYVSRMGDLLYPGDERLRNSFFIHAKDCLPTGILYHLEKGYDESYVGYRGAETLVMLARVRNKDHRDQENFIIRLALVLETNKEKSWLIGTCAKLLHKISSMDSIEKFIKKAAKALFSDAKMQDDFYESIIKNHFKDDGISEAPPKL